MRKNRQQDRQDEARTVSLGSLVVAESRPSPMAIIYRSEMDYISRCILDSPSIETGGQLFGFWTGTGIPVVLYAIGPGPRANHQVTFFNQDVDYLESVGGELIRRYALQHIGEWHSHHRLGLAHPSGHDAATMHGSIARQGLRRFLLCIGNCDNAGRSSTLNAFNFHCNEPRDYVHAAWCIQELDSPFREVIDRDLAAMLRHPITRKASHGPNYIAVEAPVAQQPLFCEDYWLRNKANNAELKRIVDYLSAYDIDGRPSVMLDDAGRVTVAVVDGSGAATEVFFPDGFPRVSPEINLSAAYRPDYIEVNGHAVIEPMAHDFWHYSGDIAGDFILCFERLIGAVPPPPDADVVTTAATVTAEPTDEEEHPEPSFDEVDVPEPSFDEVDVPEPTFDEVDVPEPTFDEVDVPESTFEEDDIPESTFEEDDIPESAAESAEPATEKL